MERGLLSQREIVKATKQFVCVRLDAREDQENAALSLELLGRVENVEFVLLDPTGKEILLHRDQGGQHRRMGLFIREEGGPAGIAQKMAAISQRYPGKADAQPRIVPWMKSLREALVQANCDAQPILVLVTDDSNETKSLEKKVGDRQLLARFWTNIHFAKVRQDSKEIATYGLPEPPSLVFIRPTQLGTKAVRMKTPADGEHLAESIEAALAEFAASVSNASRGDYLKKGKQAKIVWREGIDLGAAR